MTSPSGLLPLRPGTEVRRQVVAMAAKPVMIGTRFYAKKKDAADACREVLYRYPVGSIVDDPDDEEFLHDLLDLHESAVEKRGAGITYFDVRANEFRQPGFYIVRVDGSWTDFSFLKCLTPATHRQRVLTAFRRAVADQVLAFKNAAFSVGSTVACAVTSLRVSADEVHIDHFDPDFNDLALGYVLARGGWDAFAVERGDGVIGARLADDEQELDWANYHQAHARLQVVSKIANLSNRRIGVRRPSKST